MGSCPSRISMWAWAARAMDEVAFQRLLIAGGYFGLAHVGHGEIAMKPVGIALAARDHGRGVGARRDANQNALLRAESLRHAVALQIRFQLLVHHVGRQQQRDFPQFGKLLLRPGRSASDLAVPRDAHLRRRIHHHDLVGRIQEAARHGLRHVLAGDALHALPQVVDVLNVDGGDDGDARVQKFVYVLPAAGVGRSRRIVVSQSVHQANRRDGA